MPAILKQGHVACVCYFTKLLCVKWEQPLKVHFFFRMHQESKKMHRTVKLMSGPVFLDAVQTNKYYWIASGVPGILLFSACFWRRCSMDWSQAWRCYGDKQEVMSIKLKRKQRIPTWSNVSPSFIQDTLFLYGFLRAGLSLSGRTKGMVLN